MVVDSSQFDKTIEWGSNLKFTCPFVFVQLPTFYICFNRTQPIGDTGEEPVVGRLESAM